MTCYYPIDCFQPVTANAKGTRPVVFRRPTDFAYTSLQVPCGKCTGCYSDRSLMWALRIHHEASFHERNCFVTLTYKDPPPEKIEKKHLQDFFKRARHKYSFRYFACGEYGERTRRPHYHAIFFGEDFRDESFDINEKLYSNPTLERCWSHGMVSIGSLTMASTCYVAGYVNKKIADEDTFNLMSRGGKSRGIGHDWIDAHWDDLVRTEKVVIEGREYPVPLRYIAWHEGRFEQLKAARRDRVKFLSPEEKSQRLASLPNKELNKKAQLALRGGKL